MGTIRSRLLTITVVLTMVTGVAAVETTHERATTIKLEGSDANQRLQTLAVDSNGRILALVAPPRNFSSPSQNVSGELHILSPEGEALSVSKVDFHATAVNVDPKGNIYVAGAGRVAKFGPDGKKMAEMELEHIASLLNNSDKLRESVKAQLESQRETFTRAMKTFEERLAELTNKDPKDLTPLEERQIDQYKQILKTYQARVDGSETQIETMVKQLTSRLGIINGIAISEKDVFVASGEAQGYGYSVWRMTHDLKDAKQILSGMRGCCGQFDIQISGKDLLTAENTKHQWARYDRDGKQVGSWGQRGQPTEPECFGGCCNPMNLRTAKNGDIFTAESEGVIKRFSPKGEFVETVGSTSLSGGCKNVAVGVSPDGERVYLCDQPGSQVIVLVRKSKTSSEDE